MFGVGKTASGLSKGKNYLHYKDYKVSVVGLEGQITDPSTLSLRSVLALRQVNP